LFQSVRVKGHAHVARQTILALQGIISGSKVFVDVVILKRTSHAKNQPDICNIDGTVGYTN